MWRIIIFFALVTLAAIGFSWLADRPGTVDIVWQGMNIQFSVMTLLIGFLASITAIMFVWWLIKNIIMAPGRLSRSMRNRRREKGLDAVARGLMAVAAGDAALARKLAARAGSKLQSEALTTLLKAQAAQLAGRHNTARRLYEAMLENPETELAGLRGLYLEAHRQKEMEAARQFASKAQQRNPALGWSNHALLEIQSRSGQWQDALKTLELARKNKKIDHHSYRRQRAVLLTALAMENEDQAMEKALEQALEAHKLAPDLVPAANIAGRILAARGHVRKATRIIEKTWEMSPHPDLALTYAHARPGDSPRDRLARVKQLARRAPHSPEGPIAIAQAAIDSHDWEEAREALRDLVRERPSQRVCELMAHIEGGEFGDKGRVREWLARNTRAPRDPVWIADGYISAHWAPVSPVTGQLDAFVWKTPQEQLAAGHEELTFDDFISLEHREQSTEIAPLESETGIVLAEEEGDASMDPEEMAGEEAGAAGKSSPPEAEELVEEVEIIEARPVTASKGAEGTKMAGEEKSGGKSTAAPKAAPKTASKTVKGKRPSIYIPPRMPDDPGPLGSSGTAGASSSQKLPHRFRHSRS